MKIAIYAICKNESKFIRRFLESCRDADHVTLCDTGSDDGTLGLLARRQSLRPHVRVHKVCVSPWRFDTARNVALSLVPPGMDVCIALDVDEVLMPGWRAHVEAAFANPLTTRLRYVFDWSNDVVFESDKIHRRHGYRWTHACHEILQPDRHAEAWAVTPELLVKHLPDPTKPRGHYLELLAISHAEHPDDPRATLYYARELSFNGRHAEAVPLLRAYLTLAGARWEAERSLCRRLLSRALEALGDTASAFAVACEGVGFDPLNRCNWVRLATLYLAANQFELAKSAAIHALTLTHRPRDYTVEPESWHGIPEDIAAVAAYRLGDILTAQLYGSMALALNPNDQRIQKNCTYYSAPTAH